MAVNPQAPNSAGDDLGRITYNEALVLFEQRQMRATLQRLKEALTLAQKGSQLEADVLVQQAVVWFVYGDATSSRAAVAMFMARKDRYPALGDHEGRCHHILGALLDREDRYMDALEEYRLATSTYLDPQSVVAAQIDAANAWAEMGHPDEADQELQVVTATLRYPDGADTPLNVRAGFWGVRAKIAAQRAEWADALTWAGEAIWVLGQNPSLPADPLVQAVLLQARALEQQGQPNLALDKAIAALLQATEHFLTDAQRVAAEQIERLNDLIRRGKSHA